MPHRATGAAPEATQIRAHEARVRALAARLARVHPGDDVSTVRTHISTLVMVDDEVWKLKRPVRLPFVDFSTVAARRQACEDELRLNRRTAPQLYRDVVALAPGPDGTPADWAVRMHRFDERQRLDHLARDGRLGPAEIDALADVVARFQAGLPSTPAWGDPDELRRWARENLGELARLAPPARQDALRRLHDWSEREGERLRPLMQARRVAGLVREGHGDLHLANIVWHGGAPVLFDALEFNAAWRHLDTMGELAFTFMDLQAQGLPRMAWRFVSQVLEVSGDYAGLPLLAWHAVYRALVRAKVAALSPPRAAADAPAVDPIALAERLAGLGGEAATPPRLVLTCGLSGSGKSLVAQMLAERLGTVRVRSDVERKRLAGLPASQRGGADLYVAERTRHTYDVLAQRADEALADGRALVVDAAFLKREERQAMRALAARHAAGFQVVHCHAPEAVLLARLHARAAQGRDASDATSDIMLRQRTGYEPPAADEAPGWIELDTDTDLAQLAARCERL